MMWQRARSGGEVFFFEKEKLITMVMDPYISQIPETNVNIRGLSFYQNKVVVVYQTACKNTGRIGVLLANEPSILNGILVEEVLDEVEDLPEEAKQIVTGMWVIDSDQTE